jgi:hypothetical protein
MLRVAGQRVHRSAAAALAMMLVLFLAMLGIATLLTALMHFTDPARWGVWSGPRLFLIGAVDGRADARELLGAGIYPASLLCAFVCWQIGRTVLLWALRVMARR